MRLVISLALLLTFWLADNNLCTAKTTTTWRDRNTNTDAATLRLQHPPSHFDVVTSFDYDYAEPRRSSSSVGHSTSSRRRKLQRKQQLRQQHKSNEPTTTTERPIVRYWNSFVRSVRMPISNLSWNITNPLANFFNEGSANIIETPPVNDYDTLGHGANNAVVVVAAAENSNKNSSGKRKRKQNRKRNHNDDNEPQSHLKKQKKQRRREEQQTYEDVDAAAADDYEYSQTYANAPAAADDANYYYNYVPYENVRQTQEPFYFYDAQSGDYFGVQRLSAHDHYNPAHTYNYNDNYPDAAADVDAPETSVDVEDNNSAAAENEKVLLDVDAVLTPTELRTILQQRKITTVNAITKPLLKKNMLAVDEEPVDDMDDEDADDEDDNEDVVPIEPNKTIAPNVEDERTTKEQMDATEQLRNALGSYMRDDRFNRQRQRAPTQRQNVKQSSDKQQPRRKFNYYFLKSW